MAHSITSIKTVPQQKDTVDLRRTLLDYYHKFDAVALAQLPAKTGEGGSQVLKILAIVLF